MPKTMWKQSFYGGGKSYSTADAAERSLIEEEGGVAERAEATAINAVQALGRLVQTLHERGLLTDAEVEKILDLYGYELEDRT